MQAIKNMPGNNVCSDCGTPSKFTIVTEDILHDSISVIVLLTVYDSMLVVLWAKANWQL